MNAEDIVNHSLNSPRVIKSCLCRRSEARISEWRAGVCRWSLTDVNSDKSEVDRTSFRTLSFATTFLLSI